MVWWALGGFWLVVMVVVLVVGLVEWRRVEIGEMEVGGRRVGGVLVSWERLGRKS